jgi:predicted neuraminidase
MWQTSPQDEDSSDTKVVYSISEDKGKNWSPPKDLSTSIEGYFCTSGGWISTKDSLIAFINVFNSKNFKKYGGITQYRESFDGINWSEQNNVTMYDKSTLTGIFEQDPHILPDGRIINAAHFQPGLKLSPIYTDDPTGKTGWKKGKFEYTDNGDQSVELEPSFYIMKDGVLVMIMRDQRSRYITLCSKSNDRGENWTKSMVTNMPDSRAKQCAGNLPDGTVFLVNNPGRVTNEENATWRVPLAITLSKDGFFFSKSYLLRSGKDDDYPKQKYKGRANTLGYNYPKAFIHEEYLYVSYSTNKDDAEYTRIPIKEISLVNKE